MKKGQQQRVSTGNPPASKTTQTLIWTAPTPTPTPTDLESDHDVSSDNELATPANTPPPSIPNSSMPNNLVVNTHNFPNTTYDSRTWSPTITFSPIPTHNTQHTTDQHDGHLTHKNTKLIFFISRAFNAVYTLVCYMDRYYFLFACCRIKQKGESICEFEI